MKLRLLTGWMLLGTSLSFAQPTVEYVDEVRGVWVTNVASPVMNSKASLAAAMDYLGRNGINVVFPVVWNKGVTQYQSTVMRNEFNIPIDPFFAQQGRDPLAELIVEAHRNGIEVIPWFEFGFSTSYSANGGHIITKYPEWAARNQAGQLVVKNGFDWMNGLHPGPQAFMLSLVNEVITNYDVDGVQGDDRLPAMPTEGGYDAWTLQQYRAEHNGANPPTNTKDSNWLYWRSDRMVNFLGRMYRMVKQKDPNLIVSLSPSNYPFGFQEYLQETPLWLDSNYVDMVHPQLYPNTRNLTSYQNLVHSAVGPVPGSSGGYVRPIHRNKLFPGMLIRVGNEVVPPSVVKQMVAYNRQFRLKGEVHFFYEGMGASNQFLADTLGRGAYAAPAVLPFRQRTIRRPLPTIINETDGGAVKSGAWQLIGGSGLTPPGYTDRSLRAEANSNSEITYTANVPHSAHYRVFAYVPHLSTATTTATYITYAANGDSTVTVINQALARNGGWMPIGNAYYEAGSQRVARIRTRDITDGKPIHADAVMLLLDRQKSPNVLIPVPTSIDRDDTESDSPTGIVLEQNYPNPFNPVTSIRFALRTSDLVQLTVYDALGREVATLVSDRLAAGTHSVEFDASDLASGIYLYRLTVGGESFTKRMTLLK
jgi:uncharacterized lipoprotein YddW (UPF0748 family)